MCRVPFADEFVNRCIQEIPFDVSAYVLCLTCGHVAIATVSNDKRAIVSSTMIRSWLLDNVNEANRRKLHEAQEKVHFKNGHWG
jgi:hypothetical protein